MSFHRRDIVRLHYRYYLWVLYLFFFFKQKTAYEMRISDWSSDVCSSDLPNEFDCRIHVATRPRSARTANDQRDLGLASGTNQFGKLALDAEVGYQRFTGAKVMRPRVCRAGVNGNNVRPPRHAALQCLFAEAISQSASRR